MDPRTPGRRTSGTGSFSSRRRARAKKDEANARPRRRRRRRRRRRHRSATPIRTAGTKTRRSARRRHADGETTKQIAKALHLAETTIELAVYGQERPNAQRRVGRRGHKAIVRARKKGDSIAKIVRDTGFTRVTIRMHLKRAERCTGQKLLPGKKQRVHNREAILAQCNLKKADGSLLLMRREICEMHGCSRTFLSRLISGKIKP